MGYLRGEGVGVGVHCTYSGFMSSPRLRVEARRAVPIISVVAPKPRCVYAALAACAANCFGDKAGGASIDYSGSIFFLEEK